MPPTPSPTVLIQMGGSSGGAPWWGVPVIAGVFLIVGAALGFWFNWLLEGRKQARAEALRWDDQLRTLAADVFATATEIGLGTGRLFRAEGEIGDKMSKALVPMERLFGLQGSIELIAPKPIRLAVASVVEHALKVIGAKIDAERADEAGLLRASLDAFIATTRSNLGVPD